LGFQRTGFLVLQESLWWSVLSSENPKVPVFLSFPIKIKSGKVVQIIGCSQQGLGAFLSRAEAAFTIPVEGIVVGFCMMVVPTPSRLNNR
jgi:metal-dependent hydrolase (beta-lactamase superfamily II)